MVTVPMAAQDVENDVSDGISWQIHSGNDAHYDVWQFCFSNHQYGA